MLTHNDVMVLQKTMGNGAVSQLINGAREVGNEKHLGHVVQQAQGRVKPTMQLKEVGVNDDEGLEKEADVMGEQNDEVRLNNGTIVKDTCVQLVKRQKRKKPIGIPAKTSGVSKPRKIKRYGLGTHGFKKREQKRVGTSGQTHQSEHTVGFEVINRTSGEKRGVGDRARRLENNAPAYQEVLKLHRDHIGTGTSEKIDDSGFNSQSYRDAQRSLLENGDVSSAVQLNQLGYAFDDEFQKGGKELDIADDSFKVMVENMKEIEYAKNAVHEKALVSLEQRAEMYLSRKVARTGEWPTNDEIDEAKKKFGIDSKKDVKIGK